MRQLTLFPGHEPRVLRARPSSRRRGPPLEAPGSAQAQSLLFEDRVQLLGAFDQALERADFDEALRIGYELAELYGPNAAPAGLESVRRLTPRLWHRSHEARYILTRWKAVDAGLGPYPGLRQMVRRGLLARLLSEHSAEDLLAVDPALLPALVGVLMARDRREEAGTLLCDALLAGRGIEPEEASDPDVASLLEEELAPPWLACLGALRHLWPVPEPSAEELQALGGELDQPIPRDDTGRALSFWRCLRLTTVSRTKAEAIVLGARKRMKALCGVLHKEYMAGRI